MDYLKAKPVDPIEVKEFENACGVGVKITPDQIEECVSISQGHLLKAFFHFNRDVLKYER